MSTRLYTCAMPGCTWSGTHMDAKHTDAGARRCPVCGSGALVLADPERELRNAEGTAKRINRERDAKLPLLAHAGLVEHTDADEVLERRERAEVAGVLAVRRRDALWAEQDRVAAGLRAQLAEVLDAEVIASLDERVAGLPRGYGLSFWRQIERDHADGSLAERVAAVKASEVRARGLREAVEREFPDALVALDACAAELRATKGENAEIFWRARLRELRGVPFWIPRVAAPPRAVRLPIVDGAPAR